MIRANQIPDYVCGHFVALELRRRSLHDDTIYTSTRHQSMLSSRTRVLSLSHVSHTLGTVVPVARVIEMAHAHNVPVVVDGLQATPHVSVDVQAIGCDFYVGCGHKTYARAGMI